MLGGFPLGLDLCNASQPAAASPVNSTLPVISRTAQEGQTLTTTNATWTQAPTSYAYQWYYSDWHSHFRRDVLDVCSPGERCRASNRGLSNRDKYGWVECASYEFLPLTTG